MKTLLLTWWTGYIGSHNAVVFLEAGYDVIILDNLSNSDEWTIENIESIVASSLPKRERIEWGLKFYEWDLRNIWDIAQVFSENKIDWVIHFAGAKAVWESCDEPFYYYENNIVWSLNLFKVMEENNSKNIIFSSSANVYGPEWISPFTETHQVWNTSNPYGSTKYILERILRDLHFHKKFQVINLRYFNPVGAHESGLIGEHANQKLWNILPFLLRVADNKQEFIEIFWDDYDTPDGTWVRDYIHVMDLAKWHLAALKFLEKNKDTKIHENINLGTGSWTSVLELLGIARAVTQHSIPHKIVARREIDIAEAYCSAEKSYKLLNWKAERTVEEAVRDSWNFIQQF